MITRQKCQKIVDFIVSYAGKRVRAIEVLVNSVDQSTARFANSEMTQHVTGPSTSVTIGVQLTGRTAVLSGDDLTLKGLRNLVDAGIAYAELLPYDKTTLDLIQPGAKTDESLIELPNRFDPRVLSIDARGRVKRAKAIFEVARRFRMKASGIYQTSVVAFATGNSNGVFRYDCQTNVECSVTMDTRSSSGWQKGFGCFVKDVDPVALAERAAQIAGRSRDPIYVRPGEYTVVLEPAAVLDLMSFLWDDLAGTQHWDETSVFAGKIGKRRLGKNITIVDDVYHPLQYGFAFDDEGITRERVPLVEEGVIRRPVLSRRSVKHLGGHPTGHGIGPGAGEGEMAANLVVSGGDSSLEEMIASTQRGLLMTRVWYVRDVDPNTKLLTGMTRDGTFLIEDGKVKRGIKNLRFNQSLLDMLENVVELGEPVLAAGEEGFPAVVPPMKVEGFRFSSKTKA